MDNDDRYWADDVDTGEQIEFIGKSAVLGFINCDAALHFPCAMISTSDITYILGHSNGKLTGLCKRRSSARTIAVNYDEEYFNRMKRKGEKNE